MAALESEQIRMEKGGRGSGLRGEGATGDGGARDLEGGRREGLCGVTAGRFCNGFQYALLPRRFQVSLTGVAPEA